MRTLIIIIGGLVLLAASIGVARLLDVAAKTAIPVFVVLWFAVAAANMWMGITQAGYTFKEEFPIFLLIFGLPVAAAILFRWKFL